MKNSFSPLKPTTAGPRFLTGLFFAIAISLSGTCRIEAQQMTVSAGGEASGSGGTASYTVGQTAFSTHTGTSGSVAEGIQQPYEISVIIGLEKTDINLEISAYPNPTIDRLILKTESASQPISFQLYDINGRLLESSLLIGEETYIDMSRLTPATYFLKIVSNKQELKSFKIIKSN